MSPPTIWLRCETEPFERRTALTPDDADNLVKAGYEVFVERDPKRIFPDEKYRNVRCRVVHPDTWRRVLALPLILGLGELPHDQLLYQTHLTFGNCYEDQPGWTEKLERFRADGGILYDLRFLKDDNGHRIAAFGSHAGFAGAAAGALAYAAQKNGEMLGELEPYENEGKMIKAVKEKLREAGGAENVKALVIGALGRCGKGAVDLFQKAGLKDGI
jgi:saccharopine dehydrogenase (NAD+, L-lysine-forming)